MRRSRRGVGSPQRSDDRGVAELVDHRAHDEAGQGVEDDRQVGSGARHRALLLELDPRRAARAHRARSRSLRPAARPAAGWTGSGLRGGLRVVLDHRGDGEQQLALRVEQMSLRCRAGSGRRWSCRGCAWLRRPAARGRAVQVMASRSENVTESIPSSRRPRLTRLPLSTRGSEISRLYGPTVTKRSPSRCLMSTSSLPTNGRWSWSS